MARGRMISKTLGSSRRFSALAEIAGDKTEFCQALYPLIVAHADDFGRLEGDSFTISKRVFPVSRRSEAEFEEALGYLQDAKLISWYGTADEKTIEVRNFSEHQQLGFVYEKTYRETNGVPLSRQSDSYFDFTSADENNRERIGLFFNNENLGLAFADSIDVTLNYQELFSSGVTSFLYGSADGDAILRTEDRNFSQDSLSFNVDLAKSITGEFNHEIIYGFSF